jgi:hypothetical protein
MLSKIDTRRSVFLFRINYIVDGARSDYGKKGPISRGNFWNVGCFTALDPHLTNVCQQNKLFFILGTLDASLKNILRISFFCLRKGSLVEIKWNSRPFSKFIIGI